MTPVPIPMQGLGLCSKERLCGYHAPKVHPEFGGTMGSVFPPEKVWGKQHVYEIAQQADQIKGDLYHALPLIEQTRAVLDVVGNYWTEHASELDGTIHKIWEEWYTKAKAQGKYGAGGWAASAQQVSQYVETVKVLYKDGAAFDQILRIGTASGIHTQEEVLVLALGGVKKPKLYIVDLCRPPLAESEIFAKASVGGTIQGSFLDLHGMLDGQWSVITSHFTESFIPAQEEFEAIHMTRDAALELKQRLFHKIYMLLKPGGVLIGAIGVDPDERRFHTKEELADALVEAGFSREQVIAVPTTDPFDYDNGHHVSGNYFVVAHKKSK